MAEMVAGFFAALAGLALGGLYFGGLWWTVTKGLSSSAPALWFLGSLLLRTGVTMAGFYFAAGDHWKRWLMCLSGFVLARAAVKLLSRPKIGSDKSPAMGVPHAP